jgi:hypothetical protein
VKVRFYSMTNDHAWRHHTSWALRMLWRGHDIRWALRTLSKMLGPSVHVGRMSYEASIGPFSVVHWRGGEQRWRIGP